MPSVQDYAAEDAAYAKQATDDQNTKTAQQSLSGSPEGQSAQPSFLEKWTAPIGRVTTQLIDSAVNAAETTYSPVNGKSIADNVGATIDKGRDVAAGAITGATNMADFVHSVLTSKWQGPPADAPGTPNQSSSLEGPPAAPDADTKAEPVWDHAKAHILDFRDAIALKDPTLSDRLVQSAAQLAIPFAGFSRALSGVQTVAKMAAAGGLTDATALGPHDARFADLLALGRHTEGKLGDALRALAPDGGAVNAYINYLTDRGNESEAEGRFKNVLDGMGVNLIATPIIHGAASVLKQGMAGLRYMVDNGVTSSGGMIPAAAQRGAVGDLQANGRPPLRQMAGDPAEQMYNDQVKRDMAAAAANPNGARPPLQQGADPADALFQQHIQQQMAEPPGQLVYHGTPHDFDTEAGFDNSKIGSGEGAQTYGYGHYLAEEPETANTYQARLSARASGGMGESMDNAKDAVEKAGGDPVKAYKQMVSLADSEQDPSLRSKMQQAAQLIKSGNYNRGSGSMVTAEIPMRHIESMIDNDKPMAAQPKVLEKIGDEDRSKLEQLLEDHGENPDLETLSGNEFRQLVERAHGEGVLTGGDPAESHEPKLAAQYLDSKGIAGIKYADALSRNPVLVDANGAKMKAPPDRAISLLQEASALHSVQSGGSALDAAIARAKARGWDSPKAFYQDREALEQLEKLKSKGATFGMAGTRNFVVFDGKKIKVTGKGN